MRIHTGVDARSRRHWVLDADIEGAFDQIDHRFLLEGIGNFPGRDWLKSGVMEKGAYQTTWSGRRQGGVISPLLLNVALHGMTRFSSKLSLTD